MKKQSLKKRILTEMVIGRETKEAILIYRKLPTELQTPVIFQQIENRLRLRK